MTRVTFVVPIHGREPLTRVCLRQLRRTCDAASEHGIDAAAVIVGEGPVLDYAHELGFGTVERDNTQLGRKFNDGYQVACDPDFTDTPAQYAVPCGSDDWADPVILRQLPPAGTVGVFRHLAVVSEDRERMLPLRVGYKGGAGVKIIPAALIAKAGYRPCDEERRRGCDTSTLEGIKRATGRFPELTVMDVHPLQIVDWKSAGTQLNSYRALAGYRRGQETDPWDPLAQHYPAEALEEMRAL